MHLQLAIVSCGARAQQLSLLQPRTSCLTPSFSRVSDSVVALTPRLWLILSAKAIAARPRSLPGLSAACCVAQEYLPRTGYLLSAVWHPQIPGLAAACCIAQDARAAFDRVRKCFQYSQTALHCAARLTQAVHSKTLLWAAAGGAGSRNKPQNEPGSVRARMGPCKHPEIRQLKSACSVSVILLPDFREAR